MVVSMHLCRGNFAGAWVAEGGYDPIAELLFNGINIDVYYLEYDSARAGGFEPLRFLPKGKIAVLGIMTTKDRKLESKDELKRRIDEAAKFAPLEQLALSPQCGFSSGIGGNTMTIEEEITKLKRLVEVTSERVGNDLNALTLRSGAKMNAAALAGALLLEPRHSAVIASQRSGCSELMRQSIPGTPLRGSGGTAAARSAGQARASATGSSSEIGRCTKIVGSPNDNTIERRRFSSISGPSTKPSRNGAPSQPSLVNT